MRLSIALLVTSLAPWLVHAQGTFYAAFADGTIRTFDDQGRSTPFISTGIYAYRLAVDGTGNLYVADSLDEIYRYNPSGQGGLFVNTGFISGPTGLAIGPDGALYCSNYRSSTIFRYDQQGNRTVIATSLDGLYVPRSLAFGPDGSLFVANANNAIYRLDETGRWSIFANSGLNSPFNIAFAPNGNLFVANANAPTSIYRFDALGNPTLFANVPDVPQQFAFDPSGNLYIGFTHLQAIYRYDQQGNGSVFLDTSRFGSVFGIAFVPEPSSGALLLVAAAIAWRLRRRC